MAPHEGIDHPKEYDIKESNVELIRSKIGPQIKFRSAASEPAWNNGKIGLEPGLFVWRIEDFQVVAMPKNKYGQFYDNDSYIVLYSHNLGSKLGHDIFFWLGSKTSEDEAGTAAYKAVELDEFLGGKATQHREIQASPSNDFMALFPRLTIRQGGIASGLRRIEDIPKKETLTLFRVFKHPGVANGKDRVVVYEVEPTFESLDEDDVFILDKGDKIWVWQGKECSPMEKAKAAQVVHDMALAKHVGVEVFSQTESRSRLVVRELGGGDDVTSFRTGKPLGVLDSSSSAMGRRRLFRLSDSSGELILDVVKEGSSISQSDLDGSDVFLLDDGGKKLWVWEGNGASHNEKTSWLRVAQFYVQHTQTDDTSNEAYLTPIAKVQEGNESPAFIRAIKGV